MAIWNNVMQAPIGQTGFAIQNRVGTGIRIEPIDPRMFMYGGTPSGGIQKASTGSKSSMGTSSSSNSSKANTGAFNSIEARKALLNSLNDQLDANYIQAATSDENIDIDALNKEYQAGKSEIQAGLRGVRMAENHALIMLGQYNKFMDDIADRGNSLAFTSSLGNLLTADDFMQMSYDNYKLRPIVAMSKDPYTGSMNPITLAEYGDYYNRYSRMEGNNTTTTFERPNTEISTSQQFVSNVRNVLKDAAHQDAFQIVGTESIDGLNTQLQRLASLKEQGQKISFNLIEQNTNKYNIQKATDQMWESLDAGDRAYALSEVLKKDTGRSLLMNYESIMAAYDHTLRGGTDALEEGETKEEATERLHGEAQEVANSILHLAKMYTYGVADANMAPLVSTTEKLLSSETGTLGEYIKSKFPEATHLQGVVAKMQTMQHSQAVYMMGLNEHTPADIIGPSDVWNTKAGTLSHYDKQVLAQHFGFKPNQENDDNRNYATVAFSPSYVYMNGVAVDLNNLDIGKGGLQKMSRWAPSQSKRSEHSAKDIKLTNKFGNYIVDMPLMHQINNEKFGGVLIDPIWAAPGHDGEGVPYLGEFVAVNIEVDGNFPLVISKDKNDGTVVFEQIAKLENSPEHQAAYNIYKVETGIKDSSKRYTVEVLVRLSDFGTSTNFLNVRDSYHAADADKEQAIMEKDRNIRNAELARRKAEIAYKKENIYNQDKVRMTTDARFFYDMFDFTDDNEVLYKAGEIPKLNEIQKIESIINDLASNDVLRKPDAGASEKQLEEIKSGNIGILNMIDKEINIKEISDLINVLRMYINRQSTFTGGSQGINYYRPNYRP